MFEDIVLLQWWTGPELVYSLLCLSNTSRICWSPTEQWERRSEDRIVLSDVVTDSNPLQLVHGAYDFYSMQ